MLSRCLVRQISLSKSYVYPGLASHLFQNTGDSCFFVTCFLLHPSRHENVLCPLQELLCKKALMQGVGE
jgi:hypothetical protein